MIPLMAWRYTWRNPTRSLVVIIAIAMGIWAAMFMTGFATGMSKGYIENAIQNLLSHIQLHHPDYLKNKSATYYIPNLKQLQDELQKDENVKGFTARSLVNGMIASGNYTSGVMIRGIDPKHEQKITTISDKLIDGTYFETQKKNPVLVSKKLAKKLNAKLRSKLILTFQDLEGTITAGAFRVVGIFESGNTPFDEGNIFVSRSDINRLLIPKSDSSLINSTVAHEIAIMLHHTEKINAFTTQLIKAKPELKVENYREIAPDLQLYESQIQNVSLIYLVIIMLALVFGIINTMLMAVLERVKELGMLMAIGMNKGKVFFMIVFETLMLSLIGAPLGLLLGSLTIQYLGSQGLDLSAFSNSLQMYGLSEQIYFDLEPVVYYQIPTAIIITTLLAAIYPALKAIRLRPIEAIRKI